MEGVAERVVLLWHLLFTVGLLLDMLLFTPIVISLFLSHTPDAPILQPLFSYNVTGIENSSAVLDLKIMSVPSVVGVVWSKGGNVISSDGSKYTTSFFNSSLSNASLTLLGLKDTDIGSYTCTVSNSFKTTSVSFNLAVMSECVCVSVCVYRCGCVQMCTSACYTVKWVMFKHAYIHNQMLLICVTTYNYGWSYPCVTTCNYGWV